MRRHAVAGRLRVGPADDIGALTPAMTEETTVFSRAVHLAPLPLRIGLGIIMVSHGQPKVFGESKEHFPGTVESLGVPAPEKMARLVGYLELFGGLALIAGFLTRLIAFLFVGEFGFVILRVKWSKGLMQGYEFDLSLLAGFLSLVLLGAGAGSLDRLLGID